MNKEDVDFLISIQDLEQPDFDNACLERENKRLNKEIDRLNNIINTILDFPFFEEECPLNFGFAEKEIEQKAQDIFYEDNYCEENCNDNYKKCWLKYFNKLKEIKENNK